MGPVRRVVTLADVGRAAGVSTATVSRVLTRSGPASTATRERVQAAAERLGYVVDQAARALAGGSGFRLVIAVSGAGPEVLDDPYVDRVLGTAAEVAAAHGVGVSLHRVPLADPGQLRRLALDRSLRGLVLLNTTEPLLAAVPDVLRGRVASIGIGSRLVPSFDVDNAAGASAVLRHLHDSGRRRVAMVTGPGWLPCVRRPVEAYRRMARAAGSPVRLVGGDFTVAGGRRAGWEVLRRWPDTDAVFAVNDATALGVLQTLREQGVRVPGDVAVAGFDDIDFAALSAPGLTTATHPVRRIVAGTVRAVLDRAPVPPVTRYPSTLVLRESA